MTNESQAADETTPASTPTGAESAGSLPGATEVGPAIKIFGVGTAGVQFLERLPKHGVVGAARIAVGMDDATLAGSTADERVLLETRLLRGLGPGGDPDRARAAAEEQAGRLKALVSGAGVVFVAAGLGGGAGTGIAPVLARVARESGALALGFVTLPFACEGKRREMLANQGLEALRAAADGVVCLPNQRASKLIDENTSLIETFQITGKLLAEGLSGVWRLISHQGLIPIHFGDLCGVLRDRHSENWFATAEAIGPGRAREVFEKLVAHPMLQGPILAEADAVLVSAIGGPDLTMAEVSRLMEQVHRQCEGAQTLLGAAVAESFRDRLSITLIASRKTGPPCHAHASGSGSLDTQFHRSPDAPRPGSRFVPPPPTLAPDKVQQLLDRQGAGGARGRKAHARMRQTTLPLEIVSKGRFDKSEPTIHRGEDLDVPTYVRRGIALN